MLGASKVVGYFVDFGSGISCVLLLAFHCYFLGVGIFLLFMDVDGDMVIFL